jgi:hypothetical protein
MSIGSPECFTRFDYIDKLVSQSLAPLFISCLIPVVFFIEVTVRHVDDTQARSIIFSRYITCFFILTYVVLPSISIRIFGTFSCVTIDPDGTNENEVLYMKNELSVACNSHRYYFGFAYALSMILVYPIGIPLCYYYVLYINRNAIMTRFDEVPEATEDVPAEEVATESKINEKLSEKENTIKAENITFLYKSYEGKFWYWVSFNGTKKPYLSDVVLFHIVIAGGCRNN